MPMPFALCISEYLWLSVVSPTSSRRRHEISENKHREKLFPHQSYVRIITQFPLAFPIGKKKKVILNNCEQKSCATASVLLSALKEKGQFKTLVLMKLANFGGSWWTRWGDNGTKGNWHIVEKFSWHLLFLMLLVLRCCHIAPYPAAFCRKCVFTFLVTSGRKVICVNLWFSQSVPKTGFVVCVVVCLVNIAD